MSTLMSASGPPADDAVPGVVQELCRTIGDVHRDVVARVSREALDPLRNAAAAAASAHAGILERSGLLDADAPPALPGRAIARYRAAVAARVLGPLFGVLDDVEPGAATGAAWEEARARFHTLIDGAPAELVGPEPAGLFRTRPEDPPLLRWRKNAVRLGRAAGELALDAGDSVRRSLGRSVATRNGRVQRVPMRHLVAIHIEDRLPPLQATLVDGLAAHLATAVAVLHRAVDSWFRSILDAEVATDRAALHRRDDDAVEPPLPGAFAQLDGVRAAAESLHAALEQIAATSSADTAAAADLEALVVAEDALIGDIETAGTLLAGHRPSGARRDRALRTLDRRLDLWAGWHRRTRATMDTAVGVLDVRAAGHELLGSATADVTDAARTLAARLGATARTLRAERAALARACDTCIATSSADGLRDVLAEVSTRLPGIVEEDALAPLRGSGAHRTLCARIDERLGALQARLAELPDEAVVQARDTQSPPSPEAGVQRVRPRALLSESFDVVRLERLRAAADEAARALHTAIEEAAQARGVIEYSLRAATTEVAADDERDPGASALHDARELALTGLDRAAENLERIAAEAAARPRPFSEAAFEALHGAWAEVSARLRAEDTVHEHVLDVGFKVRAHVREGSVRASAAARESMTAGRRWSLRGVRWARRVRRLGRDAVEGERMTDEDRRRTLEALVDGDHLVDELPLVYRRLFGFRAVADRLALEGRATEMVLVRRHYRNWRGGVTDALVISGWSGAGAASFFGAALEMLTGEGATVRRIELASRDLDEGALAATIAQALDLEEAAPRTLDALADHILAQGDHAWPAVAIENLELLLLRTSRDNGLLGPLLAFLSSTDARVLWIARLARAAWTYIDRAEPTAAGLVRHLPLAPLARKDIENVILARHARSGLPLVFEEPVPPSTVLRRRLARAADEAERQTLLRAEFFDRLARASGPSVVLALLYWLRAAHVDEDGKRLRVRPLEPLGFAFLTGLGVDHTFALKAFLEHGTLSIAEHDRVLSVTRAESREIFASLANLLLIEPAGERADGAAALTLAQRDDVPWRVRPLVLHPVLLLLRARNLAA